MTATTTSSQWTHVPPDAVPIDPSYKPKKKLVTVPAAVSVDYILGVLARDGGIIISDFVSKEKMTTIEEELADWKKKQTSRSNEKRAGDAFHIIPSQTTLIPGLVGKSDTVSEICEHPLLDGLREGILTEKYTVYREEWVEPNRIDPLLSLSMSMNIGYGAPRQRLHRDDNTHRMRHSDKPEDWSFESVSQFACLIAGCDVTRENGATMFVPGSHKWGDHRMATTEEVCFAEMSAGSALVFLGSAFHGGGHNSVPGSIRTMYSLFFCRGVLRTEENQFLTVPRSKLSKMSPKMLQLLGYTKPTMSIGLVDNRSPDEDLDEIWERLIQ